MQYTFDYLVINNIDFDHPDFFRSIDEVLATFQKAGVNSKHLIINGDDEYCGKISHPRKTIFGLKNGDIKGKIIEEHKEGYILEADARGEKYKYFLPFSGLHMIYNFLAALTVCYLNGVDLNSLQDKLLDYQRPSRRMEAVSYTHLDVYKRQHRHPLL